MPGMSRAFVLFKGVIYMPITKAKGKKDGKQKYRVRVNFIDFQGNYRQKERTAYGLEEAKELEYRLEHESHSGSAERLSVSALAEEYLESKKHELRETSLVKTRHTLSNYVLPFLGNVKLDKLTAPVLQAWKNDISSLDTLKALRSKKNVYSTFRAMLNYAVRMDYLPQNPLTKIGTFKETVQVQKEMQFYTPEEFLWFISAAREAAESSSEEYEWNFYIFFNIAFYTGMRKGEIFALTWNDIQGNVIKVTKSLSQTLKGADRITAPKNAASIRDIQVPEPLSEALREHLTRCKEFTGFSTEWYICGGLRALRSTSLQNKAKAYSQKAAVKEIRIHDFRHSHASLLAHAGINIQEIARRLGHSKVSTTLNTYSHLYPAEKERALEVLNSVR